jgi:hypothetical protein
MPPTTHTRYSQTKPPSCQIPSAFLASRGSWQEGAGSGYLSLRLAARNQWLRAHDRVVALPFSPPLPSRLTPGDRCLRFWLLTPPRLSPAAAQRGGDRCCGLVGAECRLCRGLAGCPSCRASLAFLDLSPRLYRALGSIRRGGSCGAGWAGAGNARVAAVGLVLLIPGGGGDCAWRGGCSARGWPAQMGRNRRMGWLGMKVG